jgi:hypothetical protein
MGFDSSSAYTKARKEIFRFSLGPNINDGGTSGRQSRWTDTFSGSTNMRLIPAQTYSADTFCDSGGVWFQNSMTGFYKFSGYDGTAGTSLCITNAYISTNQTNASFIVIDRVWQGNSWAITSANFNVPSLTIPRSFNAKQSLLFLGAHGNIAGAVASLFNFSYLDGDGVARIGTWTSNPGVTNSFLGGEIVPAITPNGISRVLSWTYPMSIAGAMYWMIAEPKLVIQPDKTKSGVPSPLKYLTSIRTGDCLDVLCFRTNNSSFFPNPVAAMTAGVEVSVA